MKKSGTTGEFEHLIERSSLGAQRARTLRRRTPRELVLRTLERSDALAARSDEPKAEAVDIGVKPKPMG